MSEPQCDFCNSHEIAWRYRAEDFMLHTTLSMRGHNMTFPWGSEGDWAACEKCSSLIEAGEWDALVDRSVSTNPLVSLLYDSEIPQLKSAVARLMDTFREKRIGHRMHEWSMP